MDSVRNVQSALRIFRASDLSRAPTDSHIPSRREIFVFDREKGDAWTSTLKERGWSTIRTEDLAQARELVDRQGFCVALAAFGEGSLRIEDMEHLLSVSHDVLWIALLPENWGNRPEIERLVARYCYDYHTSPIDPDRLLHSVGHAYGMSQLYQSLKTNPMAVPPEGTLVGDSPVMRQLFGDIRKISSTGASVLLAGETGTGKEHVARAIHKGSSRSQGSFVAVNCAALPASLIQSELFGHERGAFTGAHARRIGRLELAEGGTIFLDEIGDLPMDLQVNLLRFLEEKSIERVGGAREIPVDARIIAATNVDLATAISNGSFREDLYYRLNVLQIKVPPLRERGEDIELLARHFFAQYAEERSKRVRDFSQQALQVMQHYDWPGNVRELMNRVRRAVVMTEGELIQPRDLGLDRRIAERRILTLDQARESAERTAIITALAHARNNISRTARALGVSRTTLYRFLEKHGITA